MAKGDHDGMRAFQVPAGELDNGIEPAGSSLTSTFHFADDVVNVHKAQYDGFGPRYGMAPLPYHSIPVSLTAPSLVDHESADLNYQENRKRLFGIVPLQLNRYSATGPLGPIATHYAFICSGNLGGGQESLALYMGVDGSVAEPCPYAPGLDMRLSRFVPLSETFHNGSIYSMMSGNDSGRGQRVIQPQNGVTFCSTALQSVTARVVKMGFIASLSSTPASGSTPPLGRVSGMGNSSEFAYQNQTNADRKIEVLSIQSWGAGNDQITRVQYNVNAQRGYYRYLNGFNNTFIDSFDGSKLLNTTSKTYGVPVAPFNFDAYECYLDDKATHNQSHDLLACAYGKPYAFLFKEERLIRAQTLSESGVLPVAAVDLTSISYFPKNRKTFSPDLTLRYQENDVEKETCWFAWNIWVRGVPTIKESAATNAGIVDIALGEPNSGLLRANSTYEFTFSLYNKYIGHETNVGTPARINTGADDFVALSIFRSQFNGSSSKARCAFGKSSPFPQPNAIIKDLENSVFEDAYMNLFEYRVYYRELGTFEWLPAGSFDASRYFFDARDPKRWVCEGPVAALPGGQPGGFNDYSMLPNDEYFQTLTYANRLFWLSSKSLVFSLKDNPYAYPVRNAVGCPKGSFLGAIVHTYPGEADQDARMVIFTTEETVAARFRGSEFGIQQPVRVSPDSIGTFYLDGSDFDLRVWTSVTAFSYRSAVNAKGVLYWWGPDGIYRDDGVDLPSKEWSEYMDPILSQLYDKTKTKEIHSVYNSRTKEILWFFVAQDGTQRALVYNTKGNSFFLFSFNGIVIDASQTLDVSLSGSGARSSISGPRIVLMCRDQSDINIPQRAVFFDELVDAGDLRISKVYMCSNAQPQGANRRLTIAPGFTGVLPSSGTLTVSSSGGYGSNAGLQDGIYPIAGGDGSTYIDVAPIGGSWAIDFPTGPYNVTNYFPVWHDITHGFDLRAKSEYWAPMGFLYYGRFTYCEQMFRVDRLIRSNGFQVKMEWLSTAGGSFPNVRTLTLSDNYRGNYRVHSQMPFEFENAEGQGISTTWTTPNGLHNGGRWYVQYLSYRVRDLTEGHNRRYEG